jgi:hypothetical protein
MGDDFFIVPKKSTHQSVTIQQSEERWNKIGDLLDEIDEDSGRDSPIDSNELRKQEAEVRESEQDVKLWLMSHSAGASK